MRHPNGFRSSLMNFDKPVAVPVSVCLDGDL